TAASTPPSRSRAARGACGSTPPTTPRTATRSCPRSCGVAPSPWPFPRAAPVPRWRAQCASGSRRRCLMPTARRRRSPPTRGARRVFAGKASGDHALPQERINALLVMHAKRGRRVVRLKGGDPFVFGRGGEEAEALAAAGVPFEIVPGVSAAVAAPAYAGIPL